MYVLSTLFFFFFFTDTATTEIYTLSLHDALPIYRGALLAFRHHLPRHRFHEVLRRVDVLDLDARDLHAPRSEEHTSELQSQSNLVCRLLLEKKKKTQPDITRPPPLQPRDLQIIQH